MYCSYYRMMSHLTFYKSDSEIYNGTANNIVHHPSSQCDVCHIKGQRVEFNLLNEHIFSVYNIVACSHAHTPAEALFFV